MATCKLLSHVDFRLIHPSLLKKIVEPLELFFKKIMKAFYFHNFHRCLFFKKMEYNRKHDPYYTIFEQRYGIYKTDEAIGSTIMKNCVISMRSPSSCCSYP